MFLVLTRTNSLHKMLQTFRMKTLILLLTLVLLPFHLAIGQQKGASPIAKAVMSASGVVRAVVVGISDYQNPKITDLQFADKDAIEFAKFLKSKAGGEVDSNNIVLLTNEKATAGQFVSALYWLIEESKEGDQVIIYFSGHGDVENVTMNQPGFLLCWDSPAKVYMGGGTFGLLYLQEIISTLSISTQAKVLIITDACRAGKLAGSGINGSQATAANLAKQFAGELKIMSCQPNELSMEGKAWGGGRGVFSYYFMAGIQGFADKNNDGFVSLQEIERYLEDKVPPAVAPMNQTPLTVGNKSSFISKVDIDFFKTLKDPDTGLQISTLGEKGVELIEEQIVDTIVLKKYKLFQQALKTGHLLIPEAGSACSLFEQIKNHPDIQKYASLMLRNLVAELQDEAQQAINNYLKAEASELKIRWSYDSRYEKFPLYLEKAASLIGKKHFFYKEIKARAYYFKGLNLRLKGSFYDSDSLIHLSLEEQFKSLEINPKAPHVLNEIGWCYHLLKENEKAINYFKQTLELSPTWVLPYVNLNLSYIDLGDFNEAEKSAMSAVQIDSTSTIGLYNLAGTYSITNRQIEAEKLLYKIIELDSTFSESYFLLGCMRISAQKYDEALSYFLKTRQYAPNDFLNWINLGYAYLNLKNHTEAEKFFKLAYEFVPWKEAAFQGIIEFYFNTKQLKNAENLLLTYVAKYPNDFFSYYLLASIYAQEKDVEKSLKYLELSFKTGFKELDTIINDPDFLNIIQQDGFNKLKDQYFPK